MTDQWRPTPFGARKDLRLPHPEKRGFKPEELLNQPPEVVRGIIYDGANVINSALIKSSPNPKIAAETIDLVEDVIIDDLPILAQGQTLDENGRQRVSDFLTRAQRATVYMDRIPHLHQELSPEQEERRKDYSVRVWSMRNAHATSGGK